MNDPRQWIYTDRTAENALSALLTSKPENTSAANDGKKTAQAMKTACADEFENGIGTVSGECGTGLSVGDDLRMISIP